MQRAPRREGERYKPFCSVSRAAAIKRDTGDENRVLVAMACFGGLLRFAFRVPRCAVAKVRRGRRPSIPAFSFMLNALSHCGWRIKVMIVDFSCLWRLAHDKWGVYAKADGRTEPDLTGDDGC